MITKFRVKIMQWEYCGCQYKIQIRKIEDSGAVLRHTDYNFFTRVGMGYRGIYTTAIKLTNLILKGLQGEA